MLLQAQGKLDEAEPLFREALAVAARPGPRAPGHADSMNNLAGVLRDQGKLDEAEPLFREALEVAPRLGAEHPDTLVSMNNLAPCSRPGTSSRRPSRSAARCWRPAPVLGRRAPLHADLVNNLASLLQAQGKLDEAEPLCARPWRTTAGSAAPITRTPYVDEQPGLLQARRNAARGQAALSPGLEPGDESSSPTTPTH